MQKSSYPSWAEWLAGLPVPPSDLRPVDANPLATIRHKSPTMTNTAWSMPAQVPRHSIADVKTNIFPLAGCPRAASLGRTRHGNRDQAGKPNCSYPALIGMALNDSKCGSLPVSAIYKYLEGEFPYFKDATKAGKIAWKSSIRHTLSQGQYFRKAEKPGMKGKRGFLYEIIPEKRAALERELMKYTGMTKGETNIATSQKPASPLPMVNVPHDGMPLVDHTAHASTVRPLPPSPKKQQWSLMSRDAFQNSPVSKHPVVNISYKGEQPHNDTARADEKNPQQSAAQAVAPPLLKLPQLPGMKRPSMKPEFFIFPEPGTYSRINVPGAEYTIPLVQPQPRWPFLRPPPMTLQSPPVGKRKHRRCEQDSDVPNSEGGESLAKKGEPATEEMPKDTTVVPFTAGPWRMPNIGEEPKSEFSDDSLSDSVFLSPQTLIGPHTPEGSPGVWTEESSINSPTMSAAETPPPTGGKTAEELLMEIPADILEKHDLDRKFVQEYRLPNIEHLLDSDVFRETVMEEETPWFNTHFQAPAYESLPALSLCPSAVELLEADRALYNLRNFVAQYFANDSSRKSILTNLGDIQNKLDDLQDASREHARSMAQSPASDDPEFNTIVLHRSLEHLEQMECEIISWWDNFNIPRSPVTQPGSAVSEFAVTSTSTALGQPQSPMHLEPPAPGKHPGGGSTLPTSTVSDAELAFASRNSELDDCLQMLLDDESGTRFQQTTRGTTSLFQQSSLPTSTMTDAELANRNMELDECLEVLLQDESNSLTQQTTSVTTSLFQQSSLPTSTVTAAELANRNMELDECLEVLLQDGNDLTQQTTSATISPFQQSSLPTSSVTAAELANRNTELDECLEMLLQDENVSLTQQTTSASTSLLQQSSRKRRRGDDDTDEPPEASIPKRIKTEPLDVQPPALNHMGESASSQAHQASTPQSWSSVYIPPEIAATFDLEEELRFDCCSLALEMGQE